MTANRTVTRNLTRALRPMAGAPLLFGLIAFLTPGPALAADDPAVKDGPAPQETPATPGIEHALPIGPAGLLPAAAADHPVGAEDLLEISVFEIPELNRTVRVSERGTISLPLLGEMEVRGLTGMQVEEVLRDALTQKYLQDPQVSVFIREYGSKKVSVIKEAGSHLYVIRAAPEGTTETIPVGVGDLLMNRNPELNLAVQPGDVVSVPIDRPVYIYVDGAVKTPGRLEELASRPITLLQAIAKAGGTTERASLKGIKILRRGADGTQTDIPVNLKRIRQGRQSDPLLEEGDVVVVPETFF